MQRVTHFLAEVRNSVGLITLGPLACITVFTVDRLSFSRFKRDLARFVAFTTCSVMHLTRAVIEISCHNISPLYLIIELNSTINWASRDSNTGSPLATDFKSVNFDLSYTCPLLFSICRRNDIWFIWLLGPASLPAPCRREVSGGSNRQFGRNRHQFGREGIAIKPKICVWRHNLSHFSAYLIMRRTSIGCRSRFRGLAFPCGNHVAPIHSFAVYG